MSQSEAMGAGVAGPRLVAPELLRRTDAGVELIGGECRACRALSFPKADVCASCFSLDVAPKPLSREGVLYSWSRVHMAPQGWDLPYAIGYVDLPEGLRILAHLDESNGAPRIGATMRLALARVGEMDGAERATYVFVSSEGARA